MSTLREVVARHPPLLWIDAASARIQVGEIREADGAGRWAADSDEAGVAIFRCVERLGVDLGAIGGFVFCDGPGSVLGIRTAAMALRTWTELKPRPVFAYAGLALVAHALGRTELGVIADARRDAWHHFQIGRGLRRIPTSDLSGELVMPEDFRSWSVLPREIPRVPYDLAAMLPRILDVDLFQPTTAPDAFLHEEPSYVTWEPRIHRAPGER